MNKNNAIPPASGPIIPDGPRLCLACRSPMGDTPGLGCDDCRARYDLVVRPKILNAPAEPGRGTRWVTGWVRHFDDEAEKRRGWADNAIRAMEGYE